VDESLYVPKRVSLVSRGLAGAENRLYYTPETVASGATGPMVEKGMGNVGFLPQVSGPSAREGGRYPMAARGYILQAIEKMVPLENRMSRQISLTGRDEKK